MSARNRRGRKRTQAESAHEPARNGLPVEMVTCVLAYLPSPEYARMRLVARVWRDAVNARLLDFMKGSWNGMRPSARPIRKNKSYERFKSLNAAGALGLAYPLAPLKDITEEEWDLVVDLLTRNNYQEHVQRVLSFRCFAHHRRELTGRLFRAAFTHDAVETALMLFDRWGSDKERDNYLREMLTCQEQGGLTPAQQTLLNKLFGARAI